MNRVLGVVFVFLLIIITAEAGYFWYLRGLKSNSKSQISNLQPPASNLKYQPQPKISPFEVSDIITTKAHDGSEVSYVYASVVQIFKENKQVIFSDEKNNQYKGKITNKTSFFVRIKENINNSWVDYDERVAPFTLKRGEVYLFVWPKTTIKNNLITLDKIVKTQ
ncbi:MAG: hypothetical protein NZP34_04960 [Caldilineales bacterium]|nr:hypothetical protein [Caldilineales bacterium]